MRTMTIGLAMAAAAVAAAAVAAAARDMSPADIRKLPVTAPVLTDRYGPSPQQLGELRLPAGKGPFPVAVVIHGGCWTKGFDTLKGTAPIASALTKRGIATWNVEYRQVGEPGGGWPGSFQDWAAATDRLRILAKRYPLDLKRVTVIGHSAGAYAALWVASRPRLAAASPVRGAAPLPVRAAVAIDGPPDLAPFIGADREICGAPVIANLMGGTPADLPGRYADAAVPAHLPLKVVTGLVSSSMVLPPAVAEDYRARAAAAGDTVTVVRVVDGDHFNVIAPGEPQWSQAEALIVRLAGGR